MGDTDTAGRGWDEGRDVVVELGVVVVVEVEKRGRVPRWR